MTLASRPRLIVYSVAVVGLGLWTSRFVRSSSDFFVAGRSLGPGLIFSSMLAANIGAGATVDAAGLGLSRRAQRVVVERVGGPGSFVLAFWVGPRLWALAKEHDFYTTGDFLEFRYGSAVRGIVTVLVGFGCLCDPGGTADGRRRHPQRAHRRAALGRARSSAAAS